MKQVQDHYYKQAKKEGYAARSAYKLAEIDEKCSLFKPGQHILDLGCYPGSWLQYIWKKIHTPQTPGCLVGVDIQAMNSNHSASLCSEKGVHTYSCDIFDWDIQELFTIHSDWHGVVSDMAPSTTGNKEMDHLDSMDLCEKAVSISLDILNPQGFFVCKVFQGRESDRFYKEVSQYFQKTKWIKPKSSRSESREMFLCAQQFKGTQDESTTA